MGLKKYAAALGVGLLLSFTPLCIHAQTGTVTAESLNIRSLPSTDSAVLSYVNSGSQLELLSYDGTWYNVRTADGQEGYAHGAFISQNPSYFGRVTASTLMVRSSTGISSPVITKLSCGSVVELLAYDGSWYKIQTGEGQVGYASAEYIIQDNSVSSSFSYPAEDYDLGYGYVSCNLTRLHESTGEYSNVTCLLSKGEKLQFLAYDGAWYKVRRESGEEGYISVYFVTLDESSVASIPDDCIIPGYVNATSLNFRSQPNTSCYILSSVTQGSQIDLLSFDGSWYKARLSSGEIGYVSGDYISLNPVEYAVVSIPDLNIPYVPKVDPTDETYSLGSQIVETAYEYLGTPYRYATDGPDTFDCSGFTMYVMNQYGITLPHQSGSQYLYGFEVSQMELIPGDLVFFSSNSNSGVAHVGIYVGEGYFIHASSGKAYSVTVSSLFDDYYTRHYLGAKRVI